MKAKKGDFVEVQYTGYADGELFDTTDEKTAKEKGLQRNDETFKPAIVAVGEKQILKGLDDALEGKETGTEYKIKINPEDGFGRKNPKLLQLIPQSKFTQQKINPMPGMPINIDNIMGTVRTVGGGRVVVDFNHPLSGKELEYTFTITRIVEDAKEKLDAVARMHFGSPETSVTDCAATITLEAKLPEEIEKRAAEEIKRLIPSIKTVTFAQKKEEKKPKEGSTQNP